MGRYVPSKTERNPREHKLLLYSSEHDSPPCITTRQGECSDSDHTAKQIVYPKRTDGKLLLLKICKSRKWLIPYQYLPLLKDGILRRVTVLLYLSKPTYRAKEKILKKHYNKKETVFHHISHTVEKKISSEIFSTNFKVSDIVMRQQNKFGDFGYCLLNRGCPLNTVSA